MPLLTPRRREGHEYLDDPVIHARVAHRSMTDVARSNALFGGSHAVIAELAQIVTPRRSLSLLDVGTGLGDIPARVRTFAARRGVEVDIVGLDASAILAGVARSNGLALVRADARHLPIATAAFDVVLCSQLLHHFRGDDALALLRELDRVARERVIISDIRRSWFAAAGIWLASWPLRFHPVSRHDGVVSVLRGFTREELARLIEGAVNAKPTVREYPGFRITGTWIPTADCGLRIAVPQSAIRTSQS